MKQDSFRHTRRHKTRAIRRGKTGRKSWKYHAEIRNFEVRFLDGF